MLEKLSPVLPSRDIAATEAFYARLRFDTVYLDGTDYRLLKRDRAEAHISHAPDLDPQTHSHAAFLRPSNIDTFAPKLASLGLPVTDIPSFRPPENKPWGMRECLQIDPDGNSRCAAQEI